MTKRFLVVGSIIAGAGVLVVIGFAIASGIDYRMAEDAGLEPGYTPQWIVYGMSAGCFLFGLGVLAAITAAVLTLRRPLRSTTRLLITGSVVAGIGVLTAGGFLVALFSGYRLPGDAGLEPGRTPEWILNGINVGLLVIGLGLLAAITSGVLVSRRRARPLN
ncbi:hypothetical protein [Arthrobacter sp. SW1]|uniref:hypothetical protein n=1 Tax=Arthrobacter sp. SW1 TaxID=1920889 RepID=UPI0014960BB1|nr:hypothetical protein [Arthrobacter sp. SW1]